MTSHQCSESEDGYGCRCADLYASGIDLMDLYGVGHTVRFVVESREPIALATFPCPLSDGGEHTACSWSVTRDPGALRLFLRHDGGGRWWQVFTSLYRTIDTEDTWRSWCETMAPLAHANG